MPAAATGSREAVWEAFGTTVVLRVGDPTALAAAREAVADELAAIDLACSRFREDSELCALNASAGRPMAASPLLVEALELALRAAALTDGAVDPTVGRSLELAGYDRDWNLIERAPDTSRCGARPSRTVVTARLRRGWRSVRLDPESRTVTVPAGISIDLGATAKAWAADRAAALAARVGDCGALVGIGGDLATCGPTPPGGWPVRVADDHRSTDPDDGQAIRLPTGGLATSSTTVRRWLHGGAPMHHIIDPRAERPARSPWRTVSVAAASCADANIASTATVALAGEGVDWLRERDLPARLVSHDGEVLCLAGWPQEQGSEAVLAAWPSAVRARKPS